LEVDCASGWLWLGPVPYKPVFPILPAYGRPGLLSYVYGTGLGVSPGGFFENGIIKAKVGYQSL
jgi:hypothetical protein